MPAIWKLIISLNYYIHIQLNKINFTIVRTEDPKKKIGNEIKKGGERGKGNGPWAALIGSV
jgi:hypothetical protein